MAEKLDRVGRNSYELTDKAKQVLGEMKDSIGLDKAKLVSFSLEYAGQNKEGFTDFIKDKMLESFKKIEKK